MKTKIMKTDIELLRKKDQTTGTWAGGTTTQLAIWPANADYKLRTFKWRVSTARVDLEESVFTSLPGIHRHIMILEGAVHLIHEGHHEKHLPAFEQDEFEGDWNTRSLGRCVDFNLMTAAGCDGKIEAVREKPGRDCELALFAVSRGGELETAEAFYCLVPRLQAVLWDEQETAEAELEQGDFLLLRKNSPGPVKMFLKNVSGASAGHVLGVRAVVRY